MEAKLSRGKGRKPVLLEETKNEL
uniref:Uncharacterized protein n=1 Tax=Arundo donax TaxID=35708 RepID=A0A0A8YK10_ARUDO